MEFQQFYLNCLAHASYLLGSEGAAAIVDPQRDVELYLEEAARRGLQIRYVIETHLHADFVSGHVELARRSGAKIYLGARAGARFPHVPVHDGDELRLGALTLRFLETPGHTPEGISVVVIDHERSPEPWAVLTGDTLFIGDVGRPDLSPEYSPQELAGMLYDSLHQKLLPLGDEVLVYPAHGAGSLCGRQMSAELSSTIGMQRQTNYVLRAGSREEFVRLLTTDLPERPEYFARDAEINRGGAPPLEELPPLAELPPEAFAARAAEGELILDTRPAAQFLAAHIPGSLNIGLDGQFASWAGTLLDLSAPLLLVAEDAGRAEESRVRLARVGIERVSGSLARGLQAWEEAGLPLTGIPDLGVEQLQARLGQGEPLVVLDVRKQAEHDAGHIAGALHHPLHLLARSLGQLDPGAEYAVHCQGGYRSAIAASLLRRAGFERLHNVTGGFNAWTTCGLPRA